MMNVITYTPGEILFGWKVIAGNVAHTLEIRIACKILI
jgi:hypothetical protein